MVTTQSLPTAEFQKWKSVESQSETSGRPEMGVLLSWRESSGQFETWFCRSHEAKRSRSQHSKQRLRQCAYQYTFGTVFLDENLAEVISLGQACEGALTDAKIDRHSCHRQCSVKHQYRNDQRYTLQSHILHHPLKSSRHTNRHCRFSIDTFDYRSRSWDFP